MSKPLTYFDKAEDITVERLNNLIDELRKLRGESVEVTRPASIKVTGSGSSPVGITKIKDNAGSEVVPISGIIEFGDDGKINVDKDLTNTIEFSVDEAQIKLDDLGSPDDNTDLNASTSAHGLCPKGDADTSHFLRGDMTWDVPPNNPAGNDTEIQFNDGGTFGGDPNLIWNKTAIALGIGGPSLNGAYRAYFLGQDLPFNSVLFCQAKQTTGTTYSLRAIAAYVDCDSGTTISTSPLKSGCGSIAADTTVGGYVYGSVIGIRLSMNLESTGTASVNLIGLSITMTKNGTVSGSSYGIYLVSNDELDCLIHAQSPNPILKLYNTSQEDGDGGRESQIDFRGEQSGGEDTTLARIQASHDGTNDDEKGDLIFYINDGNDGDSPTERLRIDSAGLLTLTGSATIGDGGGTNYVSFAADGELNLHGTARVNKEISLSPTDFNPGASGPTSAVHGLYPTYEFTIGDDMYASFEIPPDWDTSTNLTISIYWAINEAYATNSGEVQWYADWYATAVGEDVTSPGHSGNIDFGDVNIPAATNVLVKTSGTIAASSLAAGDLIGLHGSRVALDDGNNPAGAEPYIVHIEVEYTANKLGEAT